VTIPGGVPPQLLSDWRQAEERLYPVVMVRPDIYERAVRMVRAVADELAGCLDLAALAGAWDGAAEIVHRAAGDAGLDLEGLDAGLIAGAAFSMRYRELAGQAARAERLARIQAAAEAGEAWVRVEEIGSRETAGMVPWSWIEMHVRSGAGVRQTLEADPSTGAPLYSLEVVPLDPATGDRLATPPDVISVQESFDDPTEWIAAVEAKRAQIDRR
jgi:HPt (histidine-containing phosphotransfer) domain-containing protein